MVLGSNSQIKIDAVQRAFPELKVKECPSFQSTVRAQPIGREETEKGAEFRARQALRFFPSSPPHVLWVGIENGMWSESDNEVVDGACLVLLVPSSSLSPVKHVCWSDVLRIPGPQDQNFFPPGPEGRWSLSNDPHFILTQGQRSRADFLTDALTLWKTRTGWTP